MYEETIEQYIQNSILDIKRKREEEPSTDKVKLYLGTSSAYLSELLLKGVQTRFENISDDESSMKNHTITLTNKWHYFNAFNMSNLFIVNKYGENALQEGEKQWWNTLETFPCYLECHIPKNKLIHSEIFMHTKYVENKIKSAQKKNKVLKVDWNESLGNSGIVSVVQDIPREWIHSFTILPDFQFLLAYLVGKNTVYMKDYFKYKQGKGKGKMRLQDLLEIESRNKMHVSWQLKDLPSKFLINEFRINPEEEKVFLSYKEV